MFWLSCQTIQCQTGCALIFYFNLQETHLNCLEVMCRHRLHPCVCILTLRNSCMANIWAQTVVTILSPIPVSGKSLPPLKCSHCHLHSFPAFSALRAYALSDRSVWIVMVIILSALPPTIMAIVSLPVSSCLWWLNYILRRRSSPSTYLQRTYRVRSIAPLPSRCLQRSL